MSDRQLQTPSPESGATSAGAARRRLVIYSDLDGTLLDEATSSWAAARPALDRLRAAGIPLVLCSSKTRAEIEPLQRELKLHQPFVVENGGAIYLPRSRWADIVSDARSVGCWIRLELGIPYRRLVEVLAEIKRAVGPSVVGFSDLTPEEIAAECGLCRDAARRAKRREYDEPFRIIGERPDVLAAVCTLAARHRLRVTGGGRYWHLTGPTDKGRAVSVLNALFRRRYGQILTAGIGDSVNDIPLLARVDVPYLVRRPDGHPDHRVVAAMPSAKVTDGIGPRGWNEAVLDLLARVGRDDVSLPGRRKRTRGGQAEKSPGS